MDRLNYAWDTFRAMVNQGLPIATHAMRVANQAIADLPGHLPPPGDGGNDGGTPTPPPPPGPNAIANVVIDKAHSVLGAPYKMGAEGPRQFDCSGLVWWAFSSTGHGDIIGGIRQRAAGYAHRYVLGHNFTRDITRATRGDLIVYAHPGKRVSHIGIYLGDGLVISALVNPWGVTIHHTNRISIAPFGVCLVQYPGAGSRAGHDAIVASNSDPESNERLAFDADQG